MIAEITEKMIHFYAGQRHDIEHFLKVFAYASLIGKMESLDEDTQYVLEIAAIVHDIACPLCRQKYGMATGEQQQIESEALLRTFLADLHLSPHTLERVIFLVTHHHTYSDVDGVDYQILLEADFLVNAASPDILHESIMSFRRNVFRTGSGIKLLDSIYRDKI